MSTKTKEITIANADVMEQLAAAYPQEEGGKRISFTRIGMYSQDQTESTGTGKTKKITVTHAAGEFYIDRPTDKKEDILDAKGKKVGTKTKYEKEELGQEIEAIIFYKRHQLKAFDEAKDLWRNTPVFDSQDEEIPLFEDGKEIARGTPQQLKDMYLFVDKDGKTKSSLKDERVMYILHEGEAYQINLKGSSMYSLLTYERNVRACPTVLTKLSSVFQEKGEVSWNKMTFEAIRGVTPEEAVKVLELQKQIAADILASKKAFANKQIAAKSEEELDEVASELEEGTKAAKEKIEKGF